MALTDVSERLTTLAQQAPKDTWSILSGTVAFGTTLAVSTLTQLRILGISTGTMPPIPTVWGMATVCVASLASHKAAVATQQYLTYRQAPALSTWSNKNAAFGYREDYVDLKYTQIPLHAIRICAVGLIAFKLFGGRFWAISPSSYTDIGSFARISIPATDNYATRAQRATIEQLGKRFGCHTCGSHMLFRPRSSFRFVGDHMPPRAVARQMNRKLWRRLFGKPVNYRFFPQCVDCSSKQGSILGSAVADMQTSSIYRRVPDLSKAGGGRKAHFHGLRPRTSHLAGGVLGAVATVGASEADLMDENRWRYASWHRQLDQFVQQSVANVMHYFRKTK